jgi:hypothetical protein
MKTRTHDKSDCKLGKVYVYFWLILSIGNTDLVKYIQYY